MQNLRMILASLGISTCSNKIKVSDLRRVWGAQYENPEWLVTYDFNMSVPEEYTRDLDEDTRKYGRVYNPATFQIARYGKFVDPKTGQYMTIDGLVYQYAKETNPRNLGYGWKLYKQGEVHQKNSSISSDEEAKLECNEAAKELISQLLD